MPERGGEQAPAPLTLEDLVREGARRLLAAALEDEVQTVLGRRRSERGRPCRGDRNG